MAFEDEVRRLARELGITEADDIKKLGDELKKLLGDTSPEDIAERIGQVLGRLARGTTTGATGVPVDPDLLKKLLELFGPSVLDILRRIMRQILGDSSGYDVITQPPSPYKRMRIKNPARDALDLVDDLAPDISLHGTPEVKCLTNDRVQITVPVTVVQREEKLYKVQVLAHGSTGAQVSNRTKYAGQDPIPESPDNNKPIDISFTLIVDCTTVVRNLGIIIVSIFAEDIDGNQMIDFVEVDLLSHLINKDENCCPTMKEELIRSGLIDGLLKSISGVSAEDIKKLIDLMAPQDKEPGATPNPPAAPTETPAKSDGVPP